MPIQPPSTSPDNSDPQFKIPPGSDSQSSGVDFSNTPLIKPSFLQRIQAAASSLFTPKPWSERRTPPKILGVRVISSPSLVMKKLSQIFRFFFPQTK